MAANTEHQRDKTSTLSQKISPPKVKDGHFFISHADQSTPTTPTRAAAENTRTQKGGKKSQRDWGLLPVENCMCGTAMADFDSKNSAKTPRCCHRGRRFQTHRNELLFWLRTYLYTESFQTSNAENQAANSRTSIPKYKCTHLNNGYIIKWLYKTSLSMCCPQSHSWESLFLPNNSKNKTRLYVWKRHVASSKSGAMCPTH